MAWSWSIRMPFGLIESLCESAFQLLGPVRTVGANLFTSTGRLSIQWRVRKKPSGVITIDVGSWETNALHYDPYAGLWGSNYRPSYGRNGSPAAEHARPVVPDG